jgi:hypothetical protein
MEDVLEKAQKMLYDVWPKFKRYDPLKPSEMNCPAPFFLNIIARYCYEKCAKKWRTFKIIKPKTDFALVPVWVCSNHSDRKKKNKWKLRVLIVNPHVNHAFVGYDSKLNPNILFSGTVEMTYVPWIGASEFYGFPLQLQAEYVYNVDWHCGYFVDIATVDMKVLEIKKMCEIQPEFEKPAIYVNPMCEKIMPAAQTDDLPETLQKLLKKEFDSDCSTNFKKIIWCSDYRERLCGSSGFLRIDGERKTILPPEYKLMSYGKLQVCVSKTQSESKTARASSQRAVFFAKARRSNS